MATFESDVHQGRTFNRHHGLGYPKAAFVECRYPAVLRQQFLVTVVAVAVQLQSIAMSRRVLNAVHSIFPFLDQAYLGGLDTPGIKCLKGNTFVGYSGHSFSLHPLSWGISFQQNLPQSGQ